MHKDYWTKPVISLRETQQRACHAFSSGDPADLVPLLVGSPIPCDVQVQIYHNNARETFRKALTSSYPVVERLVGEACFRGLCSQYLSRFPSTSGSLQHFGARFSELLADLFANSQYEYLPDIADLEWACEQVLAGPECRLAELKSLPEISPAALAGHRTQFHEGIRLVRSDYPILTIWRANQAREPESADLSAGAEYVAVFRRGGDAVLRPVLPGVLELIGLLQEGHAFIDACDAAVKSTEGSELVEVLGSLMSLGA